ncbi:MAG: tRNA (adenosine(37)-N6)-threonylcarbamoyltransferase complex transferase subunit TsaD, partial [Rickettsiales bacterium]|nr:tRNA (adenosine(37)-N6)-threonylcarbamoyltransferase complex transferase subunit TsaD [Rickettsiales bacterium]
MEKQQKLIAMGVESSCDETAVAIIRGGEILAHRLVTQYGEHSQYGGVVPEIASRAHLENIDVLVEGALADAGLDAVAVDVFAAGAGPGLIGGLIVGLNMAKALAFASGKPFVAVNHLEAHALMPSFFEPVEFPYLLLLISGGHTQILLVEGVGRYKMLGTTIDDACGECFDKVAKMLGYGYMGGKYVDRDAKNGNPKTFDFPRPLLNSKDLNFSFSGLKTAVRVKLEELKVATVIPDPRSSRRGRRKNELPADVYFSEQPESTEKTLSAKTRADVCA